MPSPIALRRSGVAALLLLTLLAPATARAKPPEQPVQPVALTGTAPIGPELRAGHVSSLPAHARLGHRYVLSGAVVNLGTAPASGPLWVRLMRRGTHPHRIGRTAAGAAVRGSGAFRLAVRLPRRLSDGSYQVVACTMRDGTRGENECVVAPRPFVVGPAPRVRPAVPATTRAALGACSEGARTLSDASDVRLFPQVGNGGYRSVHTDVNLVYDSAKNLFLPGTSVTLTQQATQCLTQLSLDFVRSSATTGTAGPDLDVSAVKVDGQTARFAFVQPTYPGDPNGQDDPDPLAHRSGDQTVVGAGNVNPPACTPDTSDAASQNQPCAATKLVITPPANLPAGSTYKVEVDYAGRPGTIADGGTTEGWFYDGTSNSFVTTEPIGTMGWMPLNNYPTAKPTYTFTETTNAGNTAIANGDETGVTTNATDPQFPGGGSTTWTWNAPMPVQNYLVETSIGKYDLSTATASDGVVFYEAQDSSISAARKLANKMILDKQPDITDFEATYNGPYPFDSDGVIVGTPAASFEEEMETKITFAGSMVVEDTLYHENMHQWWGDNVAESRFRETYFKEGLATLAEYLYMARTGTDNLPAGAVHDTAFDAVLTGLFTQKYANTGSQWDVAPSDEDSDDQFNSDVTYTRAGLAYLAIRAILGDDKFVDVLKQMTKDYGGGNISEAQEEAEFFKQLPQTPACSARLHQFFVQWFDTAYPSGGAADQKPELTGMTNAAGTPFFNTDGTCATTTPPTTMLTPAGSYFKAAPTLTLTGEDDGSVDSTVYAIDGGDATTYSAPFTLTGEGAHIVRYFSEDAEGNVEQTHADKLYVDTVAPVSTASATPDGVVTLAATDATSGVASSSYSLDGGPAQSYTAPFSVPTGEHSVSYGSTDRAGNVEGAKTLSFTVGTATTTTTTTPTPPPGSTTDTTPAPPPGTTITTAPVAPTPPTSTTAPAPGTTLPAPTAPGTLRANRLGVRSIRLVGRRLVVVLRNRTGVALKGHVIVSLSGLRLGTGAFRVSNRGTVTLRLALSAAGRRQLRGKHHPRVKVALSATGGGKSVKRAPVPKLG